MAGRQVDRAHVNTSGRGEGPETDAGHGGHTHTVARLGEQIADDDGACARVGRQLNTAAATAATAQVSVESRAVQTVSDNDAAHVG